MMVAIEGNGTRESHKGIGWSETETMYTLNTTEVHAVAYDVYNQAVTGTVTKSLTSIKSDADHVPVVFIEDGAFRK